MRNIIILIIIVALGWWLYAKVGRNGSPVATYTPTTQGQGMKTYADPEGKFSFKYPQEFSVAPGERGVNLARITVPRGYMPQTNFVEANMDIKFAGPGTDSTCQGETSEKEAAAGNLYETKNLKKLFDGDCYNFISVIHSGNIGNYDPNQGIKEFDKAKIENELNGIVDSFKYLVNSD